MTPAIFQSQSFMLRKNLIRMDLSMAKATKLASGSWRCKANYTDEYGNYKTESCTADTKREAELMAAQFLVEMKHKKRPENKTVGEMVDIYLNNRSNVLSPSTMVGYRKIRRTAFDKLMDTRAAFVNQNTYQAAVNEYAKGRSPKTVMEAHRLICRVFKENHIDIDEKAVILPQQIPKEVRIPTEDEVKQILEAGMKKDIYLPILFAVMLGLRKSEIFAITWGDIDTDNKTVRINKAVVKNTDREYVVKGTKTYTSTRTLHLPEQIEKALPPRKEDSENLFKILPDVFSSRYKRLVAKLGFKYTFHSLRHFYASIMLLNGVPNKYAMERMGHSTDNMLKQVYQHTFSDMHREIDRNIESYFEKQGI